MSIKNPPRNLASPAVLNRPRQTTFAVWAGYLCIMVIITITCCAGWRRLGCSLTPLGKPLVSVWKRNLGQRCQGFGLGGASAPASRCNVGTARQSNPIKPAAFALKLRHGRQARHDNTTSARQEPRPTGTIESRLKSRKPKTTRKPKITMVGLLCAVPSAWSAETADTTVQTGAQSQVGAAILPRSGLSSTANPAGRRDQ